MIKDTDMIVQEVIDNLAAEGYIVICQDTNEIYGDKKDLVSCICEIFNIDPRSLYETEGVTLDG